MKPALATITFLFCLFAFSTKPSWVRAVILEPVVDKFGKNVTAHESYYVLSALFPFDGLDFNHFDKIPCPHVVVQIGLPLKGKSVKFSPLFSDDKVIYTSTILNIEFSDKIPTCNDSGVWEKTKFISDRMNVATNGTKGSGQSDANWFVIEKAELDGVYKIMFYPNPDPVIREELAVFLYGTDGKRYVGYPGNLKELRVRFRNVNDKNAVADVDEAVMSI